MKKVGKLTEARMVLPPEPKVYPMVSDKLFENKVMLKKKLDEVKASAKTSTQMTKRMKNEGVGPQSQKLADKTMSQDDQAAIAKKRAKWRGSLCPTGDDGKNESSTPKPVRQARARQQAGKPLKRGTAKTVANDSGSEMGARMAAAEKL